MSEGKREGEEEETSTQKGQLQVVASSSETNERNSFVVEKGREEK